MNFIRDQISKWKRGGDASTDKDSYAGPKVYINAGQIQEAAHYMPFLGAIDLSELTFSAFPYPDSETYEDFGVESFLDIAVFPVPDHCTSRTCDLSELGVGFQTVYDGITFLNLCQGGRLWLDLSKFQGLHASLMVPMEGSMPEHIKKGKLEVSEKNQNFEVMIANCNPNGRRISLSGQVVFEIGDDPLVSLSLVSELKLTLVALAVCLFFSLFSIRVRMGTQADHNYRLANPEEDPSDSQQIQLPPRNDVQEENEELSQLRGATVV